jgi:hypothetical protein
MKLLKIVNSRFKSTEEDWVKERSAICKICKYNTKNLNKITIKQYLVRLLSNILTFLTTGKLNKDNSECSICTCTLIYKVKEPTEYCDKGYWSIYQPNSSNAKNGIKNGN